MSTLQIRLFGRLTVDRGTEPFKGLEATKERELLSYLLIHRNRPHPRETLASVLWSDTTTEKSKKYLRQALWHLQAALETNAAADSQLLTVEHDWVQLSLHREVWLDVEEFEHAVAVTRGVAGNQLAAADAERLKVAVDLYRSDLLDGWYHDWCLFERERLQNMYLCSLDKLMNYCETHDDYETGQTYGVTILRYDCASERTYRRLMHLHYRAGDRTGALRQYERCVVALKEELGVKPERRTTDLYDRIRSDELSVNSSNRPAPAMPVALPDLLTRLRRLQLVMTTLQKRVQRDIKAVEDGIEAKRT